MNSDTYLQSVEMQETEEDIQYYKIALHKYRECSSIYNSIKDILENSEIDNLFNLLYDPRDIFYFLYPNDTYIFDEDNSIINSNDDN